jgi:hypothetical protein
MHRKRGAGRGDSDQGKLARRTVNSISSTAVNGYSRGFCESLVSRGEAEGASVIRDKSMFVPLAPAFSATVLGPGREPGDNMFIDDESKVRSVLVFTVPARLLQANSTAFIHFNTQIPLAADCSHALSFFLHALYTAAFADNSVLRLFLEVVVINNKSLLANAPDEFLYERPNVSGIRVWALLSAKCHCPEVLMRRALFRAQHMVGLCDDTNLSLRLRYLTKPDMATRMEKIRADAPLPADLCKEAGAEDAEMPDPDSDEALKRQKRIEDAQTKHINYVVKEISPPLTGMRAADARDQMTSHKPGMALIIINTMGKYVRQFCVPLIALVSPALPSEELLTKLHNNLESEWGDALRFDLPETLMTAEYPLSAEEANTVQCRLSVTSRLSLQTSNVALVNDQPDPSRRPCKEQTTVERYFQADGTFVFPFSALVYEFAPRRASPETLMRYEWPWVNSRFNMEMGVLKAEFARQRRAAVGPVAATPCSMSLCPVMSADMKTLFSTRHENPEGVHYDYGAMLRACGESVTDCSTYMQDMNRMLASYNNNTLMPGRADFMAPAANPNAKDSHVVISDLTRLAAKIQKDWIAAQEVMDAMAAPADCEPDTWHDTVRRRMRAMYNIEASEQLMATLSVGELVSAQHNNVYKLIQSANSPSDFCRPARSTDDELTVSASAIVHRVLLIGTMEFPGIVPLMDLVLVNATQSASIGKIAENATHSVIVGAPGTGKSYMAELAGQACVDDTVQKMTYSSRLSHLHSGFENACLRVGDEANNAVTNPVEMARTNPDEVAQVKQALSSNMHVFSRLERNESGRHVSVQGRIERQFVWAWMANMCTFGNLTRRPPDTAMIDRRDTLLFAYRTATMHQAPIEAALNPRRVETTKAWEVVCTRNHELMAFTIFLLLLSGANIYPINTYVVDMMQAAALNAIKHHLPDVQSKVRLGMRANAYGTLLAFTTITHELFTDCGSLLLHDSARPDASTVPSHVQLSEFAAIAAPMLYTRVDHGLWSIYRELHCYYPFIYYAILRIIAARECMFRRRLCKIVYKMSKIETVEDEVARVWKDRGLSESVLCLPAFVHDLLQLEAELDFDVERRGGVNVMPKFSVFNPNAPASRVADDTNTGDGSHWPRRSATAPGALVDGDADNNTRPRDPNWMDTRMDADALSQHAQSYLRGYSLKAEQIKTVLDALAGNVTVEVPAFAHANPSYGGAVSIKTIKFVYATQTKPPTLVTQPVSPIRLMRAPGAERATVHISTAALMVPPQYLACMALTAFETSHTRPRRTVLMAQTDRDYRVLYGWDVLQRTTRANNSSAMPTVASTAHARAYINLGQSLISGSTTAADRAVAVAQEYVLRPRREAAADRGDASAGVGGSSARDIEDIAFEKHMRESFLAPEMPRMLERLQNSPDVTHARLVQQAWAKCTKAGGRFNPLKMPAADSDAILKAWLEIHPASPGQAEKRRRKVEARFPHVTGKIDYPSSSLCESGVERTLLELLHKAPPPLVLPLEEQDALDMVLRDKSQDLRRRIAECQQTTLAPDDSEESMRAATAGLLALEAQLDAVEEELQRCVWPVAERAAVMPPLLGDDVAHAEACAKQERAITALCLELCSSALFSSHTRVLCRCNQWRSLFVLVFERMTGSRECPAAALVLSAEQDRFMKAYIDDVPGYQIENVYRLSIAVLQWLERALEFERMLTRVYRVYCGSGGGKFSDFAAAYCAADSDSYVAECAATLKRNLALGDANTQGLVRRAWALTRRVRAQWFRVEEDVHSKRAHMEYGRVSALEYELEKEQEEAEKTRQVEQQQAASLAQQTASIMAAHNFGSAAQPRSLSLTMAAASASASAY